MTGSAGYKAPKPRVKVSDPRLRDIPNVGVEDLAMVLQHMGLKRQVSLRELWPMTEIELDDGVIVSVRTKKEMRRFTRSKDPEMIEWLRNIEPGETFYDIGANCGSLTLAAAAMHRDAVRIVAIEPSFTSFESMVRNLSANGMMGFTIPLQIALGSRTGIETMNYASLDPGSSTHAVGEPVDFDGNAFAPVERQPMPTFTLDALIGLLELPPPTCVKIDVDGYEESVLAGAVETLTAGTVREALVEIADPDRAGTRRDAVRRRFEEAGYDLAGLVTHHSETGALVPGETADFLFRRRSTSDGSE